MADPCAVLSAGAGAPGNRIACLPIRPGAHMFALLAVDGGVESLLEPRSIRLVPKRAGRALRPHLNIYTLV